MSDASHVTTAAQDEWVARVLGVQRGATPTAKPSTALVTLQKSRLAWDGARKSLLAQLKAVETGILAAVKAHNEDPDAEDEYDPGEVAGGTPRLFNLLTRYDERLIDKLDEALNAEGEKRAQLQKEAAALVVEYQGILAGDEELARIDKGGFAAPMRPVMDRVLTSLAKAL